MEIAYSPEAIAARREYKRKWNEAHKDRVKAAQMRYWQRQADKAAAEQGAQGQSLQQNPIEGKSSGV